MNIRKGLAEKVALQTLKSEGWKVLKGGWPDFICVRGKKVKAVEVKSPWDRMRQSQIENHSILRRAGLRVEVMFMTDLSSKTFRVSDNKEIYHPVRKVNKRKKVRYRTRHHYWEGGAGSQARHSLSRLPFLSSAAVRFLAEGDKVDSSSQFIYYRKNNGTKAR
jgi:hypothetical protein